MASTEKVEARLRALMARLEVDGRAALFPAHLPGKIRVDASFADVLRLRRILG